MNLRKLAIAALVLLALVVFLQNTAPTELRWLNTSIRAPRAVLLGGTFLCGVVLGLLIQSVRNRRS